MDVNKRIRELMAERGWSEYTLREKSGLGQSTINNIFARNTVPKIATLEPIAAAFGMTLSQFFAEGEEAFPLTPEQRELLDDFSALGAEQKKTILNLIRQMQR